MQQLNFPKYNFRFRNENGVVQLFDDVRRKYVVCTPEEWVRQNLVKFLIHEKNVPAGLISLEKEIKINGLSRRYDVLIADRSGKARLLIECKAPKVKITQDVFNQVAEYNLVFGVPYLMVSNGLQHYFCHISDERKISFLRELPDYDDLCES